MLIESFINGLLYALSVFLFLDIILYTTKETSVILFLYEFTVIILRVIKDVSIIFFKIIYQNLTYKFTTYKLNKDLKSLKQIIKIAKKTKTFNQELMLKILTNYIEKIDDYKYYYCTTMFSKKGSFLTFNYYFLMSLLLKNKQFLIQIFNNYQDENFQDNLNKILSEYHLFITDEHLSLLKDSMEESGIFTDICINKKSIKK